MMMIMMIAVSGGGGDGGERVRIKEATTQKAFVMGLIRGSGKFESGPTHPPSFQRHPHEAMTQRRVIHGG